jgi:peptidoglycan/LPS O-acetylase OafA/YrhL
MRIRHIDVLRGVAAIMVAAFHLEKSSQLPPESFHYGGYGYTGVQIFFVISGFILPYSLFKAHYRLRNLGVFLLKRVVRIHPAYISAILIGVALTIATGRTLEPIGALLAQLVFANGPLGLPFSSAVFWTLAVEFQFYLLTGLVYPFVIKSNARCLLLAAVSAALSFATDDEGLLIRWLPFFCCGMLIFNLRCTGMPRKVFWPSIFALLALASISCGLPQSIAAASAALFILYADFNGETALHRILLFLGTISYPLYLIHWDLGRMALRLSRHVPGVAEVPVLAGLAFSILCAWLLSELVEKPSIRLSTRLKYRGSTEKVNQPGPAA